MADISINADQLAEPLPDDISCPICFTDVAKDPIQACFNFHDPFCRKCITDYESKQGINAPCPLCRTRLPPSYQWNPHPFGEKINTLTFKCPKSKVGCPWNGSRRAVADHEKVCTYIPTTCPYYKNGCRQPPGVPLLRAHIKSHLENDCQHSWILCPLATARFNLNPPPVVVLSPPQETPGFGFPPVHVRQVQIVNCTSGGGGAIRRKMLESHKTSCTHWTCRFAEYGCGFFGTKKSWEIHNNNSLCSKLHTKIERLESQLQTNPTTGDETSEQLLRTKDSEIADLQRDLQNDRIEHEHELVELRAETRRLGDQIQEIERLRTEETKSHQEEIATLRQEILQKERDAEARLREAELMIADCFEQVGIKGPEEGEGKGKERANAVPFAPRDPNQYAPDNQPVAGPSNRRASSPDLVILDRRPNYAGGPARARMPEGDKAKEIFNRWMATHNRSEVEVLDRREKGNGHNFMVRVDEDDVKAVWLPASYRPLTITGAIRRWEDKTPEQKRALLMR